MSSFSQKSIAAIFSLAFSVTQVSGEEVEDFRYRYEVIGTGLVRPMQMEMAPGGKIYFNELDGILRLLDPETKQITKVGTLEVFTPQESGFLGFALDPDFVSNGHIFIHYSPLDYEGEAIARYVIKDEVLVPESKTEIMRWPVQRKECCHHAGAIRFGPDGNLYISTGDNTSPFQSSGFTPIDERPERFPFDAQKSSANTNDLRGKILRIRPGKDGGYTIPEGNLFKPGMEKTRPEIYAMGFRNPWRFNIDQKSGIVYVGDVGPDSGATLEERGPNGFDTINQIRKPGYFGWPYSRGNEVYREFNFETESSGEKYSKELPKNDSPNNSGLVDLPPVESPMIWYPSKATDMFPEVGTGGRTACAGPVYHFETRFADTDGFPPSFNGSLLIYDWQRPFLLWARLDKDSNFERLERFSDSAKIAQGDPDESGRFQIKRVVDAIFGPEDGCLYVMDYGETWGVNEDAQIVKIRYQRGNLDPVAEITATTTSGKEPVTLKMSAANSSDPEGKTLSFEWRLQPGGERLGNERELVATLETPGNYQVELMVTDAEGGKGTASKPVVVGNTAPAVTIISPVDGDFFFPGKSIDFQVEVKDQEDGGTMADQISMMTLVTSEWFDAANTKAEADPGMTSMKQSDCFNCHAVETRIVGPTLLEIADRYRGQPGAANTSADRVLNGSAGVWGEVPMLPHSQLTKDEIYKMVEWIFSLEKGKSGPGVIRGASGIITAPTDRKMQTGVVQASYTDFGNGVAGPLAGLATVKLRSNQLEAESADELIKVQIAGNNEASGKKILGAASGETLVKFSNLNLNGIKTVQSRHSSPDEGRRIELRFGAPDGDIIGVIEIPKTPGWGDYTEMKTSIKSPTGRGDLYLKYNGALNLDWLRFEP